MQGPSPMSNNKGHWYKCTRKTSEEEVQLSAARGDGHFGQPVRDEYTLSALEGYEACCTWKYGENSRYGDYLF